MNTDTRHDKRKSGQSLIELALALPVMLIMISGLIEFGFALNQYLNALDAAREAARYGTDSDPLDRDVVGGVTDQDCGTTLDFYMQAACVANQTMDPVTLNPTTDDVVISVFRVLSGTVIGRWPNCEPNDPDDCPIDPPALPETLGEWHLFGRGDGCGPAGTGNGLDDDGDDQVDDGCIGSGIIEGPGEDCDEAADTFCHPSRITTEVVEAALEEDAPDSAVLVVEVFYDYPHVMQLPWIAPFVPNPLPMHTYTILPLPAAEPSLTITGTVRMPGPGGVDVPVGGATINFNNGMIAVTGSDGTYERTGLTSGQVILTPELADCVFENSASYPNPQVVNLGIANVYDVDFRILSCPTPPPPGATVTHTPTPSATPPATSTPTPTATGVAPPTATVDPGCVPGTVDAAASLVEVPGASVVQADGFETIEVFVTVVDTCGNPVTGQLVALSSSRPDGGTDTITSANPHTDGGGVAVFSVVSTAMSDWAAGTYQPSIFTATVLGVSITNTGQGAFACVGTSAGTHGPNQVGWSFHNDTGIDRRLSAVTIHWSTLPDPGEQLLSMLFGGTSIWSTPTSSKPAVINAGWAGVPNDRNITAAQVKALQVNFNIAVTGGQPFTVIPTWTNTAGTSVCTSDPFTVTP